MKDPAVPRIWPGATVVCIASGPSLTQEDVEYCRGKARVIVVNDAVRLAPWADVLYTSDRHWIRHYEGMPGFMGLKFTIRRLSEEGMPSFRRREDGWTVLRNAGESGLELSPDGLRHGRSSGVAAVNLSVHTGARRVVLLGYDMADEFNHFFGEHPKALRDAALRPALHKAARLLKAMAPMLSQAGVEVVNCSRRTALTCFPQMTLEDALR